MQMVEIKADVEVDGCKVGECWIYLTEDEFNEYINMSIQFLDKTLSQSHIQFLDINGNRNKNFTIPTL